jgi:aspartate racemase
MRVIGMVGGTSWEATQVYYRLINQDVKARLGGYHSARMVIVNVEFGPIEAAMRRDDWDEVCAHLSDAGRQLQAGGAGFVMLTANTAHECFDAVADAIDIPMLHIVDPTADAIDRAGLKKVGLLGTRYTMEREFLRQRLEDRGLEVIVPEEPDRTTIHDIVFDELVLGKIRDQSRTEFVGVMDRLVERGAAGIILGCTEFGLLVSQADASVPLFDTTELHARAAVDLALAEKAHPEAR